MNERIKMLRKALGLNQSDFGQRLGVTGTGISKIENGERGLTETMLRYICCEFRVNEEWLRTGGGEMFASEETDLVAQLSQQYHLGIYGEQLLATYLQLSDSDKRAVERFVAQLTANVQAAEDSLSSPAPASQKTEKEKGLA